MCGRSKEECFELSVKKNTSIMEAYNCDRQKPGQKGTGKVLAGLFFD